MFRPIYIAMLGLTVLIGFYATALAQPSAPSPDVVAAQAPVQPPQPPVQQTRPAQPAYVAPVPFGGLYNTISGAQPPGPGQPRPLTPFNATP